MMPDQTILCESVKINNCTCKDWRF